MISEGKQRRVERKARWGIVHWVLGQKVAEASNLSKGRSWVRKKKRNLEAHLHPHEDLESENDWFWKPRQTHWGDRQEITGNLLVSVCSPLDLPASEEPHIRPQCFLWRLQLRLLRCWTENWHRMSATGHDLARISSGFKSISSIQPIVIYLDSSLLEWLDILRNTLICFSCQEWDTRRWDDWYHTNVTLVNLLQLARSA